MDLDQEMRPGSVFDASTSTTDPSRKGYFMDYENKRPKRPKLRPPPPRGGPQVYGGKGNFALTENVSMMTLTESFETPV